VTAPAGRLHVAVYCDRRLLADFPRWDQTHREGPPARGDWLDLGGIGDEPRLWDVVQVIPRPDRIDVEVVPA
jgi:hypothetical protein